MELGSPRATQRLQMQTLLRRSSMATADVQQIPGVTGPLRKRSRTDQPSISTPAYLANQQAIVDGSGGSSTTGVVGQQSGGSNPTGLAGEQPGGSSTTTVVGQQPGGSSTTGLAGQQPGGSSTTTVVGQQPGGSSTTGLAGQQPGGSSTTTVVGQQPGGSSTTGLAGQQPGGSSTTTVVGQQPGGSSTTGLAGQQPGGSSTTTVVGQQPGGSSTTGLAGQQPGGSSTTTVVGQQPGGSSTTGLAGQPSSRSFAVTALQMYNKRLQYGASAAQYLAALLDPRYRRLSQHVTREQCKLAEQLLIKLATEDGSEGDRPAAEALSQLAIWQQPDVVLFSHTSLSAVYFAPQLTSDPVSWWRQHGDFAPKLQTVAQRVLCIPATAAANERVLERKPKTLSDADWEEYERWMRKTRQDQDQN
ncbi:hypothetical protein QJQ45_025861 [Haematococcus lacustris]|nr:hypothetical protein QJQ45_025861 [Haematococcus lacustris]